MVSYPVIDPIALQLGPLAIRWYGVMYFVGIFVGWWLLVRRAKSDISVMTRPQVDDLVFYMTLGIILGARIGYVFFYNLEYLATDPLWLFRVWEGGMSFHGGLLGTIVAIWIFTRRYNIHIADVMDFAAPVVPIGLGAGRIGNFIGQELWGRPTDLPWAMVFPADVLQLPRHPSQLYEMLLEGVVLFIILFVWLSRRPRPRWMICGSFIFLYGVFRFLVEFAREPDSHIGFDIIGVITRGQLLCLPMIIIGAVALFYAWRNPTYAPASRSR